MPTEALSISAIPAFQDNYIWLLTAGGKDCAVVDPGDASPVLRVLKERGLNLRYILLTHHHWDHAGGVPELLEHCDAEVYGPDDNRIEGSQHRCHQGDLIELPELGISLEVIEVPAHTSSHIAFFGAGLLFSGDTLFSIGCGRLFEGSANDMQLAMDKFAVLPGSTKIYCGHEYTQSNCDFALKVEPQNEVLQARSAEARKLREQGLITLPSTIDAELAANPFMRTHINDVIAAARKIQPGAKPGSEVLAVIRSWKDSL
jgi:hydroxyacylglutathione hydrolase